MEDGRVNPAHVWQSGFYRDDITTYNARTVSKLKVASEKGMPFKVSVDALFSKMCNHTEKRSVQKAVLYVIIIQDTIVRERLSEKIWIEGVRFFDIYFVLEFRNPADAV